MSGAKLDATHPPKGWRLVVPGEKLPAEKMFWSYGSGPWERNNTRTGAIFQHNGMFAPCAVRADISKPCTPKPKRWVDVDLLKGVKKTVANAYTYNELSEAQDTINKQGREIVRLKNQAKGKA
jgi:hypothetical protein